MSNPIKVVIKDIMKKNGFKCYHNAWYRLNNDLIQKIGIQKSAWGNQYYINVEMEYYDGSFLYPSEFSFSKGLSIVGRVEDIVGGEACCVFNYELDIQDDERNNGIKGIICQCIDYLNNLSSMDKVIHEYRKDAFKLFIPQTQVYKNLINA